MLDRGQRLHSSLDGTVSEDLVVRCRCRLPSELLRRTYRLLPYLKYLCYLSLKMQTSSGNGIRIDLPLALKAAWFCLSIGSNVFSSTPSGR